MIQYHTVEVGQHQVFYRRAGKPDNPAILLLHGFPTSSHMFRDLIPRLAQHYFVIAPDMPGFGNTVSPPRGQFAYTFDGLTDVIDQFIEVINLNQFAMYAFDYGAPVGWRLASRRENQVWAIVSQNGNAYEEGLSEGWSPIRAYWDDASTANRDALRAFLTPETTYWQYTHGVSDSSLVSPDGYSLDNYYLSREGNDEIQLDLFGDYQSNVALYPKFQDYFRNHRPPLLAVWGKNDPFFLPAGAEAFRRDLPDAEIQLIDTGHFALETHADEIASRMRSFLAKHSAAQVRS